MLPVNATISSSSSQVSTENLIQKTLNKFKNLPLAQKVVAAGVAAFAALTCLSLVASFASSLLATATTVVGVLLVGGIAFAIFSSIFGVSLEEQISKFQANK